MSLDSLVLIRVCDLSPRISLLFTGDFVSLILIKPNLERSSSFSRLRILSVSRLCEGLGISYCPNREPLQGTQVTIDHLNSTFSFHPVWTKIKMVTVVE